MPVERPNVASFGLKTMFFASFLHSLQPIIKTIQVTYLLEARQEFLNCPQGYTNLCRRRRSWRSSRGNSSARASRSTRPGSRVAGVVDRLQAVANATVPATIHVGASSGRQFGMCREFNRSTLLIAASFRLAVS